MSKVTMPKPLGYVSARLLREFVATIAYRMADAMLKAREQT